MSSHIQSVLFDKEAFKPYECRMWLKRHDLAPIKRLHEAEGFYRYRIAEPSRQKKYRMITLNEHIKMVIEIPSL